MEKTADIVKCPRAKLILGVVALLLLGLGLTLAIAGNVQNRTALMGLLAILGIVLSLCAAFLVWHFTEELKKESFDDGMHIVMESVPMVCSLYDKDNNIMYCNKEAPKLFGFKEREEYYENYISSFPEFQPDGSRTTDIAIKNIADVMKNGSGSFEWWQKRADGELIPLHLTCVCAHFRGEVHVLEFTQDKRGEREAQRKREEAVKERMQAVLDSTPMLCAVYDQNGNALEVNKEAEAMFGIPDKQMFIKNHGDFFPERQPDGSSSAEKNMAALKQAMRDGGSRYEFMYRRKDGTPVPTEEIVSRVTIDGKHHVIVFSRDLREFYANKEAEQLAQKKTRAMMDRLNGQLETQASAITESSAAVEEMIANIRSVNNTLSKNAQNVRDLLESSELGHSGINEVAVDIREISSESESLLEINQVMQNIASQTNLLSMNAAIEAAHAGQAGRGFAVVADEIRKLAENSNKQSKTISVVLKKIKDSIDKITRSTDNVLNKFKVIDSSVKTVAEQESGIFNAMTEQDAGSSQIMQAIAQLNEITYQVKADARQMVEAAAKLGA